MDSSLTWYLVRFRRVISVGMSFHYITSVKELHACVAKCSSRWAFSRASLQRTVGSSILVPFSNLFSYAFRHNFLVELLNVLRNRYHRLCDDVDKSEHLFDSSRVVPVVELARVNRLVSHHPDGVKRLLDLGIEASILHQVTDLVVERLALCAQVIAESLDGKPQESRCTSG
jgi:hypothetical protein